MANSDQNVPHKLREAFDQALSAYPSWMPMLPERLVTVDDKLLTLSEVCGLVEKFRDALPVSTFHQLSHYMAEHKQLRDKLERDQTYSTAANCFRQLIERCKRHPQLFGEQ
jgi:hypothetical protein